MTDTAVKSDEGLRREIHAILESEVERNPVTYNAEKPYQSYERIGFVGRRWSVERRVREYGLEKFFDPDAAVLDIGSNFGFFVCEFALHCKLVHGIEPNPELNLIGRLTADHLGVGDRVAFFDCPFAEFENPVSYDTVFSLAAFFTADGRERTAADEYFRKVNGLLSDGGRLFYESTSYTKGAETEAFAGYQASTAAVEAIDAELTLEREWETPSGSAGYFRRFSIAERKSR